MLDFLDLHSKSPGYLELSQAIIDAIESGRLPAGSPLPPSRVLAQALGISRDTVLNCYRHLKTIGWTEAHSTAGTVVASAAHVLHADHSTTKPDKSRLSEYAASLLADTDTNFFPQDPVAYGAVPKEYLPIRRWKQVSRESAESLSRSYLQYQMAVLGRPELRSAVAGYLNRTRGLPITMEEVAVFNLSFAAFISICRLFLKPGDTVATEDPGFGGMRDTAMFLSLDALPVPLDSQGLSVEALTRAKKKPKLVYVTPNHQEPTGLTMSLTRRQELLSWAQKNNAWIIEDDYDGIFHYGTRMPPTLKSMDTQDNVIYLSSFWQVLYPLTTLCCAVLPQSFMAAMQSLKRHTGSLTDSVPQLALASMLDDGYLQKYCRKLEREFAASRRALIYELKRAFGSQVSVPHHTGGLTMMVRFHSHSDERLLTAARNAGLEMLSTDIFYADSKNRKRGEMQLYFVGMTESATRKAVARFAKALSD